MFSYKDDQLIEDDDPIIIDYQLVNYGHPAYDLVRQIKIAIVSHLYLVN